MDKDKVKPSLMDTWRQRCKVCNRVDYFDFTISDECWRRIVPAPFRHRVVCLQCFDSFASQKGISYIKDLSDLVFVGDMASFDCEIEKANIPLLE